MKILKIICNEAKLAALDGRTLPAGCAEELRKRVRLVVESAVTVNEKEYADRIEAKWHVEGLLEVFDRSLFVSSYAGWHRVNRSHLQEFHRFLTRTVKSHPAPAPRRGPRANWFKPMLALNVAKVLKKHGVELSIYDDPAHRRKGDFAFAVSVALDATGQKIADTKRLLKEARQTLEAREAFEREAASTTEEARRRAAARPNLSARSPAKRRPGIRKRPLSRPHP